MVLHVGFSSDVTMVTSIIQRAKEKCAKGWAKGTVTLETSIKVAVSAQMTRASATCEVTLGGVVQTKMYWSPTRKRQRKVQPQNSE